MFFREFIDGGVVGDQARVEQCGHGLPAEAFDVHGFARGEVCNGLQDDGGTALVDAADGHFVFEFV